MDGETIAAIASAVVSLGAAGVAYRESHIAKAAAQSAEEQVALMRRQVEGEEEHRREDRGPQFAVEGVHINSTSRMGNVTLRQTSGPPLSGITVDVTGDGVHGKMLIEGGTFDVSYEDCFEIGPLAAGGTTDVPFNLEGSSIAKIFLHLNCRSADGTDSWHRSVATTADPFPEVRRRLRE
ncbi:hypothetical protein [Streptomyces sp. NBC_00069]|uniref:hypothetical protein n=1 Tax=Streptomyces sp. NBC_00069 TaxID=2975639 RepID=UPI0032457439